MGGMEPVGDPPLSGDPCGTPPEPYGPIGRAGGTYASPYPCGPSTGPCRGGTSLGTVKRGGGSADGSDGIDEGGAAGG